MAIKVSVVVPVYNPGRYIEDCIQSLLRQSLPTDEFEVLFVDDGSTDATPHRLDSLQAEHHHLRVIHQENSGWSGKPRNVGIEAARGEYVYFVDNDDWLGDAALERLCAFAKKNDADIVVGKMAGKGRGVPRELFRRTYDEATLDSAPLIDSLTPHKMFRKAFLDEHGLRFPEGRRRLEDHVFVTEAYFLAERISVLSDYVCYYHVRRDDSSNAGFQRIDPEGYFRNLREALDVVERHTEPGGLRDKLFRRWLRVEMVERLRGARFHQHPPDYRGALFSEIRATVLERFGPGVWAPMGPVQRLVVALIRADRLDDLVSLAAWEAGVGVRTHLAGLGWHAGALGLTLTAELDVNDRPLTFRLRNGRALLDLPLPELSGGVIPPADLDATTNVRRTKVDVVVRSRESAAEYPLPATYSLRHREVERDPDAFSIVVHAEARLDPESVAGGSPLPRGIWDVVARLNSCGWSRECRVGSLRATQASEHDSPVVVGPGPLVVTPYWTPQGHLSLDVGQETRRLEERLVGVEPGQVATLEQAVSLTLPLRAILAVPQSKAALRLAQPDTGRAVDVDASLQPAPNGPGSVLCAVVPRSALSHGRWRVHVRLVQEEQGEFAELPLTLTVPGRGPATLNRRRPRKRAAAPEPPETRPQRASPGPGRRTRHRAARKLRRLTRVAGRRLRATLQTARPHR